MDRKFILTCGSTVDLPYDYCQQREIPVIFYTYVLDGVEREDDMERNPGMLEKFYQAMRAGAIPQTPQINTERYIVFFTQQLNHGGFLHIAFGSGTAAVVSPVGRLAWKDREISISGGQIGKLTQDFYDTLTGIQYGEREDPFGWVVKIS